MSQTSGVLDSLPFFKQILCRITAVFVFGSSANSLYHTVTHCNTLGKPVQFPIQHLHGVEEIRTPCWRRVGTLFEFESLPGDLRIWVCVYAHHTCNSWVYRQRHGHINLEGCSGRMRSLLQRVAVQDRAWARDWQRDRQRARERGYSQDGGVRWHTQGKFPQLSGREFVANWCRERWYSYREGNSERASQQMRERGKVREREKGTH